MVAVDARPLGPDVVRLDAECRAINRPRAPDGTDDHRGIEGALARIDHVPEPERLALNLGKPTELQPHQRHQLGDEISAMKPTEFSTIINIGWAVLLSKLSELRVRTGDDPIGSEKMEKLHGLLLKAVELSEARRLWNSV